MPRFLRGLSAEILNVINTGEDLEDSGIQDQQKLRGTLYWAIGETN